MDLVSRRSLVTRRSSDHSFMGGLAHESLVNGHQTANRSLVRSADRNPQDKKRIWSVC